MHKSMAAPVRFPRTLSSLKCSALSKKIYGDLTSLHYLSEIKGQETDIVMITKVEGVRIASTLLPLNFSAWRMRRFDISKYFSTDSGG